MASIDAAIQAFSEASAKVKNRGGVHRGQSAFPNLTWAQSIDKIFTTGRMAIFVIWPPARIHILHMSSKSVPIEDGASVGEAGEGGAAASWCQV